MKNSTRRKRNPEPKVVAERNIDDGAFVMTFDEGEGYSHSVLTCFRIDEEQSCLVLGEVDGEITAFIDAIPDEDEDD